MENTDRPFIEAILNNDSSRLEGIYHRFLPAVAAMVRHKSGTFEDAKDVFQESLVVVFNHAARPGFQLTSTFQAYLLGICRFVWLRQLKKNARTEVALNPEERFDLDADLEHQIIDSEKRMLYRENFIRLGEDCRQLLQRFFDREPLARIADDMGWTTDYVKKKNGVCKKKLMELIQHDPRFAEFSLKTDFSKTATVPHEL